MNDNKREVFSNQPGHCLVFDLHPTIPVDTTNSIITDIINTLKLSEALRGSIRIPAIGLYTIANEFHIINQINFLRTNFASLKNGLLYIKTITLDHIPPHSEFEANIKLWLQRIIDDFNELPSRLKSSNVKCPGEIDITFITMKEAHYVLNIFTSAIGDMTLVKIKNIYIKSITKNYTAQQDLHTPSADFIQIIKMSTSSYFKTWLRDYSFKTDLILKFSEKFGNFSLHCNLQECVLNTSSVPYNHAFQLQTDAMFIQLGSTNRISSNGTVPLHTLEIMNRLPQGALSDISVIGVPYYLTATNSFDFDLEKLNENSERFKALCYTLGSAEECLLCRQLYDRQDKNSHVYGRFVVIPGNNVMIIQALAVSELLQPVYMNQSTTNILNPEATLFMRSILNEVPILNEYNPSEHKSGLYDIISHHSLNKQVNIPENVSKRKNNSIKASNDSLNQNALLKDDEDSNLFEPVPSSSKKNKPAPKRQSLPKKPKVKDFELPAHPALMKEEDLVKLREFYKCRKKMYG